MAINENIKTSINSPLRQSISTNISQIVGRYTYSTGSIVTTSGSFTIGETYIINQVKNGDDFTNVGYVENGMPFVAIATTANTFTHVSPSSNTQPRPFNLDLDVFYNTIDPLVEFTIIPFGINIGITNSKFDITRLYPTMEEPTIVDLNNITAPFFDGYFKIEVYD